MDSDSYGSSLSSPESDYQPVSKKKVAKKKADSSNYRIEHALKPPRATTYTAQSLVEQLYRDEIDLDPEYQREVVWPDTKQVGLVDSILRNYYVPPIVFKVQMLNDGTELKTCIDGKQRLTTIERFMSGQIYHRDIFTNKKYYYTDVPKKRAGLRLPESYRRAFANKQIVCVEYTDLTDDDEREIFKRVQLGMALTPAERLQAIASPAAQFTRECISTYLTEEALAGSAIEWEQSRGADFRCIAQVIFNIMRYPAGKNLGSLSQLETYLSNGDEVAESLKQKVYASLSIFADLVNDRTLAAIALGTYPKIAPVEFIAIPVLIAAWKDRLSRAQLAHAVVDMRRAVRTKNKDIRLNDGIGKQFVTFIRKLDPEKVKGAPGPAAGVGTGTKNGSTKNGEAKRKRATLDSSEDEAPLASIKRPTPTTGTPAGRGAHGKVKEEKPTPRRTRLNVPSTAELSTQADNSTSAKPIPPADPQDPLLSSTAPTPATSDIPMRQSVPPIATEPPDLADGTPSAPSRRHSQSAGGTNRSWQAMPTDPPRRESLPASSSMPSLTGRPLPPLASALMSMGEPVGTPHTQHSPRSNSLTAQRQAQQPYAPPPPGQGQELHVAQSSRDSPDVPIKQERWDSLQPSASFTSPGPPAPGPPYGPRGHGPPTRPPHDRDVYYEGYRERNDYDYDRNRTRPPYTGGGSSGYRGPPSGRYGQGAGYERRDPPRW